MHLERRLGRLLEAGALPARVELRNESLVRSSPE
jgi:hypothetical protein